MRLELSLGILDAVGEMCSDTTRRVSSPQEVALKSSLTMRILRSCSENLDGAA